MKKDASIRCSLDPAIFNEKERKFLTSPNFEVGAFRYRSGVEALRIRSGRGEFVWLPYLGQQIWDWNVDGKSLKFEGFVSEPSYGRNFLQNYGAFLVHCGMTAMGNPGADDTHTQHGELPVARFDEAWIDILQDKGESMLSLGGRLHWHVPFVAEYFCVPSVRISGDGLSLHAELRLENPTASAMDYMYLAHINFAFSGARRIMSTLPFDTEHASLRNEIFPGLSADPEAIKRIEPGRKYEPELVAIVNGKDAPAEASSILVCDDGSCRWVSQEMPGLDHQVVWITSNEDRGACGFHLPSTAGPSGFASEKAQGKVKRLTAGSGVALRYACGFSDKLGDVPIKNAR